MQEFLLNNEITQNQPEIFGGIHSDLTRIPLQSVISAFQPVAIWSQNRF
jgi:hypothetical protein